MVKFKACTVRSGNFYSFKNLSFSIHLGKHYRITGHNGAGKTILAEAIAGRAEIVEGQVEISPAMSEGLKQLVSYVPARTFEILFNASENVFYQQRYYSVANQDIKTVLDYLGDDVSFINKWKSHPHFDISHLFAVKLTGLSNGQLRKLVLLKQMARNSKILVMDYPYDGLDKTSRNELNDLLEEMVQAFHCSLIIVDNTNTLPKLFFENIYVEDFTISQEQKQVAKNNSKKLVWKETDSLPPKKPVIQCVNVNVSYGDKKVIKDFNWQVNKKERWLLSGENGSGKSTILSLIFADHPQAYKNDIYLWGKKRGTGESIWDIKNKISFLSAEMFTYASNSFKNSQKTEQFLLTHFQGPFEMEHVNLKDLKLKTDKMLEYFGLSSIKSLMFRHLSSGQKQLLLIIRTFLFKKPLILLDEPFQYLDKCNKEKALQFINEQLTLEDTLIVISHYKELEFSGITHIKEMKSN